MRERRAGWRAGALIHPRQGSRTGVTVSEDARIQGRVAYVNGDRGYGFIRPLRCDGVDDAFFHRSDLTDAITLRKGQRVSFAVVQSERGPRAIDVQVEHLRRVDWHE